MYQIYNQNFIKNQKLIYIYIYKVYNIVYLKFSRQYKTKCTSISVKRNSIYFNYTCRNNNVITSKCTI